MVILDPRVPFVAEEVEIAIGRAHRHLELAREVRRTQGLARLQSLDGPQHPSQRWARRRSLRRGPADGASLGRGHGGEQYTPVCGRILTSAVRVVYRA